MSKPPAAVLTAPLPIPRRFTLLDAATVVTDTERRAPNGAVIDAYLSAPASVQEAFAQGSARVKAIDGEFAFPEVDGFTVYLGVTCTAAGVRPREQEFRRRLQAQFRSEESTAVEKILVNAAGLMTGPYLTDSHLEQLASGSAQSPTEGLGLLENAIARVGNGMIHVTPAAATAMEGANLLYKDGGVKRTKACDTLVAVGAGYIGAYPLGGSSPSGDQDWAFASSFVEVHRDEDLILGPIAEALDRSTNDVTFIAERNYLVAWVGRQTSGDTNHIQAGVLIDRSA